MKKILLSLVLIGGVVASGVMATRAYFSDTETSAGNTISAGTIDISVDNENPWTKTYTSQWTDFKPGVVQEMTFVVKNDGENPVVLRKMIGGYQFATGAKSEPECAAEVGTWNNTDKTCSGMSAEDNDLSKVVVYSMTVTPQDGSAVAVIPESWGKTLADVGSLWVPLGAVEPGKTLAIKQTYRLKTDAGNQYQGDTMTYSVNLYAEQKDGPGPVTVNGVVLDNKDGGPNWYSVVDGKLGFFKYDNSGKTYSMTAYGLEPSASYRLTYRTGSNNPADLVSGVSASDGSLTLSGSHDFAGVSGVFVNLTYGADLWGDNVKNLWEGNQVNF